MPHGSTQDSAKGLGEGGPLCGPSLGPRTEFSVKQSSLSGAKFTLLTCVVSETGARGSLGIKSE